MPSVLDGKSAPVLWPSGESETSQCENAGALKSRHRMPKIAFPTSLDELPATKRRDASSLIF